MPEVPDDLKDGEDVVREETEGWGPLTTRKTFD